jgi:hypothetical protein
MTSALISIGAQIISLIAAVEPFFEDATYDLMIAL